MRTNSSKRQWAVAALIAVILAATLPALAAHHARLPSLPPPAAENARIPAALLPRVNASFAADDPAYAVATLPDDATTLRAANPAHHLITTFAPDGVTFAGQDDARWSLRLSDIKADTAPIIAGGRVEYRRGNLTEWYLNGPLGVEQGFTLAVPPASGDAFVLTVATGGNATPRLDGGDVTLTLPDGKEWVYGDLLVTDAAGRQLPARLEVAGDTIAIRADLAGAVYPVTVDPFVQQKKLTSSNGAASDFFGDAVAMSGDGSRVVVGASSKSMGTNTNQGEAYVYSGTNYATETKLTASDGAIYDNFGGTVAISGDGTRVAVGAGSKNVGANAQQGEAYVYSGTNYATEQRLTDSDGAGGDNFGHAVAISGDGTRIVVGVVRKTVGANTAQGAAYVYGGANYGTETKLTASDGAAYDNFGVSVGMSGDGTRVIVGAYLKKVGTNTAQGAAYVYSGTNYATEQRLTASDGAAGDHFGAVAISGDGTRVVVGAYLKTVGANTWQGATYVFAAPLGVPNPVPSPRPGPAPSGHPAPLPRLRAIVVPASGTPNPLPARRP